MHGKSSKKVWMAIKVDLEKAYVRLFYIGNFAACASKCGLDHPHHGLHHFGINERPLERGRSLFKIQFICYMRSKQPPTLGIPNSCKISNTIKIRIARSNCSICTCVEEFNIEKRPSPQYLFSYRIRRPGTGTRQRLSKSNDFFQVEEAVSSPG
jgi:hypothetical protein